MATSLNAKLGLNVGARACLVKAPEDVAEALRAGEVPIGRRLSGSFTFILAFFTAPAPLDARFASLRGHLAPGGALWIAWPKGGRAGDGLGLKSIIAIGYRHGLVESKTVSVNATWSAIKFTWPRGRQDLPESVWQAPGCGRVNAGAPALPRPRRRRPCFPHLP